MPGAMANTALIRPSCTYIAGPASSGRALRRYAGTIRSLRQARWKEIRLRVDRSTADPQRRKSALRMSGDADALRIDALAPKRIVQQETDVQADIDWTLPQLVGQIRDGGIVVFAR